MRTTISNAGLSVCAALVTTSLCAASGSFAVGNPAPEIAVQLQSGRTSLRDFVRESPAGILHWSRLKSKDSCEVIAAAARVLASENVRLIVSGDLPNACAQVSNVYRLAVSGDGSSSTGGDQFAIVDTFGVVRAVRKLAKASDLESASKLGAQWESGRQAFSTHCEHCHGDDGDDRAYPNIKTLKRITTRMSEDRVLDGGQQFGAVDMSNWTAETKETILLYIRGL